MELEIKDLNCVLEAFYKFHDTLEEISNSLITIKEVMLGKFSESELHYEVEHLIDRLQESVFMVKDSK